MKVTGAVIFLCVLFASCAADQEVSVFSVTYDLSKKEIDWTGDFADYPEGDSIAYQLTVLPYDTVPSGTSTESTKHAIMISGNNLSEDLFMFIKTKVKLRPNTEYEVMFNIKLSSNATASTAEIDGSGESVFLKAGASLEEPKKMLQDGMYIMNIDKGNQEAGGVNMITLGTIAVAATTTKFTAISRYNNSSSDFHATTDDEGEMWLIVGTDSGFKGTTTLYYTQIDVLFNQM